MQLCIDLDPSCKDFWIYHLEKLLKQDQAILNGNIFALAFITTFMNFVGMINNLF